MFLLLGALFAGMLTVLAPCVLPLLPIIIGGSITGDVHDRRRPFLIAGSLAVSLLIFTVLLKATALLIHVPPNVITYISGGIIIALGLAMLFPITYATLLSRLGIEPRAQRLLGKGTNNQGHVLGPILTGAALGPVFSSCSPVYAYILATVLPAHFADALAYIVVYVIGLASILLAIGYYGRKATARLRFFSNPNGFFQRGVAIVFVLVGVAIITGTGTKIQVFVADHTPFQLNSLSTGLLPKANAHKTSSASNLYNVSAYKAPDFTGIQGWVNSQPLTMSQLKGKVVLVDFWTYTCINCIRTIPYLEGWYNQYKNDGLVIVGVEAPEFSYEKVPSNVEAAVKQDGITYPVAIDGNLATWNAYQNEYWPADYLIDRNGDVRRQVFGEGDYAQTEQAIRGLLTEGSHVQLPSKTVVSGNPGVPVAQDQTPETYLGYNRADSYEGNPPLVGAQLTQTYHFVSGLDPNDFSLSGTWQISGTNITSVSNAKIEINVNAKNVYVVGGATKPSIVTVLYNGQPVSQTGNAGADVQNSQFTMQLPNLYRIVSFKQFTSGTVELEVPPGVSLNTFTFGS